MIQKKNPNKFTIIEEIESNDINGKFVYICVFVWYYNALSYYIYLIKDAFYMIKITPNQACF